MPVPAATRDLVQHLLLPHERIDYLFPAEIPTSPFGAVYVAVTSRTITVVSTGVRGGSGPASVLARYSRRTRLGPLDLSGVPSFVLGGIRYEVESEYVAVVNALDAERAGDALPPDPLPDL